VAITAVNLTGFFHVTQAVVRQMLTQESGGHIVNLTTSLVDHAESENPSALVSLTKGGLAAVTRSLATEYASRGVRCNAVSLGVIQNPAYDPASYEGLAGLHPMGRVGQISDVVEGILYFERASFVTGVVLHIDGGQSAGADSRWLWLSCDVTRRLWMISSPGTVATRSSLVAPRCCIRGRSNVS
jgi:NAD(P)-dependent dehydrogenase (short-subunit alcohol dehydrogenase family)